MKTKMFKYRFVMWNKNMKQAKMLAENFLYDGMFSRLTESPCGTISVTCISENELTKGAIDAYEKVYGVCLVESEKVKV